MFLSKRSNGIYYIFYENYNGKRTCKSTKTKIKKEAYKFLSGFSSNDENIKKSTTSNFTLKEFSWKFLKYSETNHTWKTTLTCKTTFNSVIDFLGNKKLIEISNIDMHDFIQHRIATVSLHAGRKDLINIKASFNWALSMDLVSSNPTQNLKRIRVPERQPLFFSRKEYNVLIDAVDNPQIKAITEIAVNTGMRQMEILSLRWSQVNLVGGYVTLNNQNHITKGKRIRTIPLNSNCVKVFGELLKNKETELVFHFSGEQIKQDYLVKNFKRYIKKVNINPQLNFHSLRHTFASWLVQRGVSIYQVSKLLGHADIKTTEIYAHLRAEDLRESVEMLN
jgi:site-specific recombinase XerD